MAFRTTHFAIAALISGIALLALYGSYMTRQNDQLVEQLEREQLRNESLLAEKLSVEKHLFKARKGLNALKTSQADLSSRLARKGVRLREETKLSEKLEKNINSLHDQLHDSIASLSSLSKENNVLRSKVIVLTKEAKKNTDSLKIVSKSNLSG
jgi:hypothetical protein